MKGEISNLSFFHKYYMANNNEIPVDFIKTDSSKLSDVQKDYPGAIIHVHDTNKDDLYIGNCKMTDNFNVGEINDDANTIAVGGLKASKLGDLKDKSMSQIIMDIVCPLTYPTVTTNPSIKISYSGSKLVKVNTKLPLKENISFTANRGKLSDCSTYAGELVNVTLDMNPANWGGTSTETVYTITGTGEFADGEIPKDSHDNQYQSGQYKSGTVNTNQITITSVYPIYINTDKITEMTERLVNYNTEQTFYVTIPPEVDGTLDKFRVNLPSTFTSNSTFTVKQYNSLSGKYDIDINMVKLENNQYIRTTDVNDTKTGIAKYEIKLKK